jgi:hypothetical protein
MMIEGARSTLNIWKRGKPSGNLGDFQNKTKTWHYSFHSASSTSLNSRSCIETALETIYTMCLVHSIHKTPKLRKCTECSQLSIRCMCSSLLAPRIHFRNFDILRMEYTRHMVYVLSRALWTHDILFRIVLEVLWKLQCQVFESLLSFRKVSHAFICSKYSSHLQSSLRKSEKSRRVREPWGS